jgi:hypothetical protein
MKLTISEWVVSLLQQVLSRLENRFIVEIWLGKPTQKGKGAHNPNFKQLQELFIFTIGPDKKRDVQEYV